MTYKTIEEARPELIEKIRVSITRDYENGKLVNHGEPMYDSLQDALKGEADKLYQTLLNYSPNQLVKEEDENN